MSVRILIDMLSGNLALVNVAASIITARLTQSGDYRIDQAGNYRIDQSQ